MFPDLIKEPSNIVKLTYREHYVCHHLLYKIYESKGIKNAMHKMASAWMRMCKNTNGIHVTHNEYESAKSIFSKTVSEFMKGKKHAKGYKFTDEQCKAVSLRIKGENNPFYGKHHSNEAIEKNKQAHLGRKLSEETKRKIKKSMAGIIFSEEHKRKVSEAKMGHLVTDETRQKIREKQIGKTWWNDGTASKLCRECPRRWMEKG